MLLNCRVQFFLVNLKIAPQPRRVITRGRADDIGAYPDLGQHGKSPFFFGRVGRRNRPLEAGPELGQSRVCVKNAEAFTHIFRFVFFKVGQFVYYPFVCPGQHIQLGHKSVIVADQVDNGVFNAFAVGAYAQLYRPVGNASRGYGNAGNNVGDII